MVLVKFSLPNIVVVIGPFLLYGTLYIFGYSKRAENTISPIKQNDFPVGNEVNKPNIIIFCCLLLLLYSLLMGKL